MDREIVKLEKLAEQGDASAMFELGCMYEKGTTIDIKKPKNGMKKQLI